MKDSNIAVYGIYENESEAEMAVNSLKNAGFSSSDVSVLFASTDSSKQFAHEKHTKAPEGATTGAGAGAVVGGTLGWLAGIGAIAIPGVGPFIAAGPIMGLIAGLGVGGAIGTVTGALIGLGIPEYEAKRYEGRITNGGVLLSVHCLDADTVERAKDLLKKTGADDIGSKGEASGNSNSRERVAHTY